MGFGPVVGLQLSHEPQPGKRASQRRVVPHWFQAHRVFALVESELDLVPGADPEPVAKIFGNHDLPFRSNPMSHTR